MVGHPGMTGQAKRVKMKDTITKDHFVCINLCIEDLHSENLEALGLISRRLAN